MNVFEAAQQRIEWALTEFDYCYVISAVARTQA